MDLPKNLHTFDFSMEGASGKKYEGTFIVRCNLSIGQKYNLELEKTRLLANYSAPSEGLSGFAIVLSNLRTRITDGPEWWKQSGGGFKVEDEEVLVALYDKVMEAELVWKESLKKKSEEIKEQDKTEDQSPT